METRLLTENLREVPLVTMQTDRSQRMQALLTEMQQKYMDQSNVALELISNVIGVDEEGHAHQQIPSYAVKRLQRLFKLDDSNLLNCILESSPMQIYFLVLE